ncbi:MAG: hypothetical protein A2W91_20470 [Bacteroidetes bacterium GWF2_38_335]|nr:MAG: hypothetical protein A2W91_20470 [Bacteroidetes bacterium GWF2_38_335]OFY79469.1 MAG: hypothetical protein A2281_13615 [Bacteroidetes bacterium RIFOXYA12_FULL_38_20]HBS86595.1 Fe-S oxidoreductase [Bacteroidales bacterium]
MTKQIIFAIALVITIAVFLYTASKILAFFKLTKPAFPIKNFGKRFWVMMDVAIFQSKIMRRPIIGFLHAIVFWGFLVILIGTVEMVIDGLTGTERVLTFLGPLYDVITASGDIFAFLIAIAILVFLFRRVVLKVKRFHGVEMKKKSHIDANIALTIIFLLMISLLGMNTFYYLLSKGAVGTYPVSEQLAGAFSTMNWDIQFNMHETNWWAHILLIFLFANILPYSKHFHVFMSVPNVFLSRLEPLGKLTTMESIRKEVTLMMNPETAYAAPAADATEVPGRFGILDIEDASWKNYLDSLSCTECGRCTSVCPANITGKKLSPRKLFIDLRARMKEKGPGLVKNKNYKDEKTLIRDYISPEELWACTTCNACAKECPVNINHPSLIVDMRRYLVMEESAAPAEINSIFSNIENNGAPWQFSPQDRMLWANIPVPTMQEKIAKGETPEYLWWVGSAGAFDDRYKKVSLAFAKILNHLGINYAVLGVEESTSGDVARRAGNEMLFQMQAMMNMELFKNYEVKKIITCDPHAYNTFKNEYPDFGAEFEVIHHSVFLANQIKQGKINLNFSPFKEKTFTYHDPCYLGRLNNEYDAPRYIINSVDAKLVEMKRCKSFALCCGAGGGQMFKEAEKGDKEVYMERTEDALAVNPTVIVTACPYCMVMITDGLKYKNKEEEIKNYDIAEIVTLSLNL